MVCNLFDEKNAYTSRKNSPLQMITIPSLFSPRSTFSYFVKSVNQRMKGIFFSSFFVQIHFSKLLHFLLAHLFLLVVLFESQTQLNIFQFLYIILQAGSPVKNVKRWNLFWLELLSNYYTRIRPFPNDLAQLLDDIMQFKHANLRVVQMGSHKFHEIRQMLVKHINGNIRFLSKFRQRLPSPKVKD